MQNFKRSKKPDMLSDYELSQQLNQLLDWVDLSHNAKELLIEVSARMEFANHMAPLFPQADRAENVAICFETAANRSFMDALRHHLEEALGRDRSEFGQGDFINKILNLVDRLPAVYFDHNTPYCSNFGILINNAIVQYKPDFSDFRILCFSKVNHGVINALMINRGDFYPFYIRFDGEPRELTQDDFLFWDYNEVYHNLDISTLLNTITTHVHRYSTGQMVAYTHQIKE